MFAEPAQDGSVPGRVAQLEEQVSDLLILITAQRSDLDAAIASIGDERALGDNAMAEALGNESDGRARAVRALQDLVGAELIRRSTVAEQAEAKASAAATQAGLLLAATQALALGLFTSTAAGLAAVQDGAPFFVQGSGTTLATLYRRQGTVAVAQGLSIPSTALLDTITTMVNTDDRFDGHRLVTESGSVLAEFGTDGVFKIAAGRLIRTEAGQEWRSAKGSVIIGHQDASEAIDLGGLSILPTNRYLFALTTEHGGVAFGIRPDLSIVGNFSVDVEQPEPDPPIDAGLLHGGFLFQHAGYPAALYPRQIAAKRTDAAALLVSVSADRGDGLPPVLAIGREQIDLPTLPASATLMARPADAPGVRTSIGLTVVGPRASARGAVRLYMEGDSISNRQLIPFVGQAMTAMGWTPTHIGTIASTLSGSPSSPTGPLGEARETRSYADFAGFDTDGQMAPLAAGQEAAYLASTKDQQVQTNPFLRLAVAQDYIDRPTHIVTIGGQDWIYDFAWYLTRFGLQTPQLIIRGLGRNDQRQAGSASAAADRVERALRIMHASQRAAIGPSAPVILWYPPEARSVDGDTAWASDQVIIARKIAVVNELRQADPKLYLVSTWAGLSIEAGFPIANNAVSDAIHPATVGRRQLAAMLAVAADCTL
ncbi:MULTISPECIES: hypothetical protein [unclassified Sphingobium]|uniref:hypothetical protein n=1 Tax=unclassified Sphingobium TaxID=2611147 RepID=UPI0035A73F2C